MLNSAPAVIEIRNEPALIRGAAARRRSGAVPSLPRFAYAFVREHLDSVAALARVLRGAREDDRDGV